MLTDMRKTEHDEKKHMEPVAEYKEEAYPWGLRIFLDDADLTKLKMPLPKVGSKVRVIAEATVVAASEKEEQGGEKCRDCTLQITEMEIKDPGREVDLNKMYPGK